jgi:hypothetical protein
MQDHPTKTVVDAAVVAVDVVVVAVDVVVVLAEVVKKNPSWNWPNS